jgi:uncharacterized Zn-finger protein
MPVTARVMSIPPPEVTMVNERRVACDGAEAIRGGPGYVPSALGHPRVWLEIDEHGYVDCGYCDRRFVLQGAEPGHGNREVGPGDLPPPADGSVN